MIFRMVHPIPFELFSLHLFHIFFDSLHIHAATRMHIQAYALARAAL